MQIDRSEAARQLRFRNEREQEIAEVLNIEGSGNSNFKHEASPGVYSRPALVPGVTGQAAPVAGDVPNVAT